MNKYAFVALLMAVVLATTTSGLCEPSAQEIDVFCAAGLTGAFNELGQIYENESNVIVVFNFDGAQVLRAQIENGAEFRSMLMSLSQEAISIQMH